MGLEVAIVGMTGRFPGARDLGAFWRNIDRGVESIATFSDEELLAGAATQAEIQDPNYVRRGGIVEGADEFDARFFGFYPREAEILDPQQRVFLECAWEALERAGYDPEAYDGLIGVYAGAGMNTYLLRNLLQNRDVLGSVHGYQLTLASDKDFLCTRVSYKLNLRGPSVTVQSGCSTSLVAIHLACQGLLNYHCDMALAGGVAIRPPLKGGYLYQEGGIASPDGKCRAFDAAANGTVPGAGVGLVVLKRLADAMEAGDHIHAVIKGSAVNNDGAVKVGYTAPSVNGQAETIATALSVADVHPDTVSYVETHGTGTSMGDPIEIAALTQAFRDGGCEKVGSCAIGSLKTNIGHLDAAAGVASLIKTALALEKKVIPPSLNYEEPNPAIDFAGSPFFVNTDRVEWKAPADGGPRRAGVSSFGMGGTNAHVVLQEAPPAERANASRPWHLLLLSARTPTALERATRNMTEHLRSRPDQNLSDVAYTLQIGRRRFEHRRAVVCRDAADFVAAVEGNDPMRVFEGSRSAGSRSVAFMFTGQGAQYVEMAAELYETEAPFRHTLDECAELLLEDLGLDLREVLYPSAEEGKVEAAAELLNQTFMTQPALFVVEYALAKLWSEWGIRPDAMIGHSIGEYVAACLAGVFSLEDALSLVVERGRMMQGLPGGAMLSVQAAEGAVLPLLVGNTSIAAINAPELCAVSGPVEAIERLELRLGEREIACTRLRTSHAFHSAMMEPILDAFAERVRQVPLGSPQIPFISNVTGTWITESEATDPSYWARHLRYPVRFADGVRQLLQEPARVLLEIGPGTTLTTLATLGVEAGEERDILPSMRHPKDTRSDLPFLLGTVGRLVLAGVEVDWSEFHSKGRRRRLPLPTYPFERERYWIEPQGVPDALACAEGAEDRKRGDTQDWLYLPSWKRSDIARDPSTLPGAGEGSDVTVVFSGTGLGSDVAARLREHGHEVVLEVEPTDEAGYRALFDELARAGRSPRTIVHAWNTGPEAIGGTGRGYSQTILDRGYYSVLRLAQALGGIPGQQRADLYVLTSGVHDVTGEEKLVPVRAAVHGPADVVSQEYPYVVSHTIDVVPTRPGSAAHAWLVDSLAREIEARAPDRTVAYRGLRRWVRTFEPIPQDFVFADPIRIREGGAYLITGGLGRIGLTLAESIARRAVVKLVLLGRSPFPPSERWDDWLASHDVDDPTSRRISRIRELEARGSDVLVLSADVADVRQMKEAVTAATERFGDIRGVIHAAGAVGEQAIRSIADTDRACSETQFSAKLEGLLALDEALASQQPDFWMLQSSLATVLGGPGFAAYSAANHFLDAFATQKARNGDSRWLSVNWDAWDFADQESPGSAADAFTRGKGVTPAEGADVFERLLAAGVRGQVVVSTADLHARLRKWLGGTAHDGAEDTREPGSSARHARPQLPNEYVAPSSDVERAIVGAWELILGIAPIGVDDDFFELGGHSLLATQLVSRMRDTFRVELPLRDLFENSTVAGLAALVEGAGPGRQAGPELIRTVHRDEEVPLSFAQQRIWFLDQLEPGSPLYNNPAALRVLGPVDAEALEACLRVIVQRHEALRTAFMERDGRPEQSVVPSLELNLMRVDLRGLDDAMQQAEVDRLAREDAVLPFDLSNPPLLRASLLSLDDANHVILLTMHHIVSDGWSVQVLLEEIAGLYPAIVAGETPALEPLPIQYADYAVWQREWLQGPVREAQLDYWRQKLSDLPPPVTLPTDRPRPSVLSFRGDTLWFDLPSDLTEELRGVARSGDATLFMVLLAVFQVLLHRYSGQDDVLVGTPVANRGRAELEGLIGFFINTLVLRADCGGDPTFREFLSQVRESAMEAFANQDLPFETLVEELEPERDLSTTPLFQVMFVYQKDPIPERKLSGVVLQPLQVDTGTAKFDLTLSLEERGSDISGWLNYNSDLFVDSTVERMAGHLRVLLEAIAENPNLKLSELPILTGEELQCLEEWSRPEHGPSDVREPVYRDFERQASRSPSAVAVVCDTSTVEYRELNATANRLARGLRRAGVGRGTVVAVALERSPEAIAALLGVLKAGAVYLPLDPALPDDRVDFMLDDSRAGAVMTRGGYSRKRAEELGVPVVDPSVDADPDRWPEAEDLPDGPTLDDVAYVIYTSGSTGRPKGIIAGHRELARHCRDVAIHYELSPVDHVLQFASHSFDQSLEQILPTLAVGATIMLRGDDVWTAEELHRRVAEQGITVVNLPPAYWHLWAQEWADTPAWKIPDRLRLVISGGDRLHPDTLRLWCRTPGQAVRLLNAYGPTEATITATTYEVQAESDAERDHVPIGRPLGERSAHVLDMYGNRVPIGVRGELCVGGALLARGYLNRPDLTAAAFVPDPFAGNGEALLYRTGDVVRYLSDGNLEYLGRIDDQIKIRGFRIEPGEVESVLVESAIVHEAVVTAHRDGSGAPRLVAYITGESGSDVDREAVNAFLEQRLPRYMIPAELIVLPAIPRTASGKVDRSRLPEPTGAEAGRADQYVAPRTPVEEELAEIWADVLSVERVGIHDDFFALGGHSLLGTQLISRVRKAYPIDLPLRRLFETPTVAGLASLIAEGLAAEIADEQMDTLLAEIEGLSEAEVRHLLALEARPHDENH